MEKIAMREARDNFSEIVNRVAFGKERLSLTRKNKPMAVLVPIEDLDFLEAIEEKFDMKQIELALEEMDLKETVSWKDLKEEVGL